MNQLEATYILGSRVPEFLAMDIVDMADDRMVTRPDWRDGSPSAKAVRESNLYLDYKVKAKRSLYPGAARNVTDPDVNFEYEWIIVSPDEVHLPYSQFRTFAWWIDDKTDWRILEYHKTREPGWENSDTQWQMDLLKKLGKKLEK
jgi:hypothetical protein